MVFNSAVFLFAFFPAVFLLTRLLPWRRARLAVLCVASLVFYAFGELRHVPLLLGSVLLNWLLGRAMDGAGKKRWCALGVALNLGLLGLYKYLDFFTGTLSLVPGIDIPALGLSLPAGISFFTFQAVSYLVDRYRGKAGESGRFWEVLLYMAFFPRLISGPLVRFDEARAQCAAPAFSPEDTAAGLRRFIAGLAKKVLLADMIGAVTDAVFALEAAQMDCALAWLGAVAYTLQLYFDFSGYSDMAIGLGRVFGFRIPENFDHPYASLTITEFWRRWHITLSRWFRDYVYIPLGGNRRGRGRTAWNKCCVFLLTGLWHGAGWTFVVWGLWHGAFMMLESAAAPFFEKARRSRLAPLLRLYTWLVVVVGFVIFRASSLAQAFGLISRLFVFAAPAAARLQSTLVRQSVLSGARILALALGAVFSMPWAARLAAKLPDNAGGEALRNVGALLLFVLCLLGMAGSSFTPFIYARF